MPQARTGGMGASWAGHFEGWVELKEAEMAKSKDLIAQGRKASTGRNGRIKKVDQLRLLASKHVLRKASRRVRRTPLF